MSEFQKFLDKTKFKELIANNSQLSAGQILCLSR
jgi:hypothetical protein